MFTLDVEMDLFEFDDMVGFWSGAKDRWIEMTEDEKRYLNEYAEDIEFDSLAAVNDFVWFESDEILEEYRNNNKDEE